MPQFNASINHGPVAQTVSPLDKLPNETLPLIISETMSAAVHDANKHCFAKEREPLQKVDAARIAARQAAVLRRVCLRLNHAATHVIAKSPEIGMIAFVESLDKLAKYEESVFKESIAGLIQRTTAINLDTSVLSGMSKAKQDIFFEALEAHVVPRRLKKVSIYHPERGLRPGAPYHEKLTQRSIRVTAAWNRINLDLPVEMNWNNTIRNNTIQPFVDAFIQGNENFCNVKNFNFFALDPAAMTALVANFPKGTVTKAAILDSYPSCLRIFTDALMKGGHAIDHVIWSGNDRYERRNGVVYRPCTAQAFSSVIKSDKNTLVHLSLRNSFVSPDGVKTLAEALAHDNCILETLDLRNTPISSADMLTVIRAAGSAKNLKVLDLRNCELKFEHDNERKEAIAMAKEKNSGLEIEIGLSNFDEGYLDSPR